MGEGRIYRVLLIDDEPFMLSQIKQLIDWEKNGCVLAGTAANGAEALEKLNKLRPDLVICDIVIPDISGLELLKRAEEEFPDTVFIMLTNYEDFELVRESLRFGAVEYLVKNNLEREVLGEALKRAGEEREKRSQLHRVEEADEFFKTRRREERIREAVSRFLETEEPLLSEDLSLLDGEKMLACFAFVFIPLNLAILPEFPGMSAKKKREILDWETEIAGRLAGSFFPNFLLLPRRKNLSGRDGEESLLLFVWGISREQWESAAPQFRERLIKTSSQIIRLGADVISSAWYETAENMEHPASVVTQMEEQFYKIHHGTHSDAVKRARQYIMDHIQKRIMLHDAAKYAGISPGYLSTLFRKEYNQNLVDFINQVKTERACEMLGENRYRINEIAYKLGFENAFYFTKVFRRHTGLTPSEYLTGLRGRER